ncbi:MAG: hypothetical protein DYG91_11260 [Chloroflexi bacterium CFX7]|nr:hypothetical protein [Chloroflexi bacterium CFX7]MCK6564991.1 hypothetical protein [Dehalococcoidia bacterium]MCL4231065.1 hypothetical protein [Dehalococcoidia bacterium]RIL01517.1 MAG: hypothetical protein DCC78_10430 [bacterium]
MAEKHFEADDPYELVAARVPLEPGVDADELMARCFIEEYALLGTPRHKMMQLFRSKFFAGTNVIYENRGEEFVQRIIDEVFGSAQSQEVS